MLVSLLIIAACSESSSEKPSASVNGTAPRIIEIGIPELERLEWRHLNMVIKYPLAGTKDRVGLIKHTMTTNNPVAIYLGALLLLAENEPTAALQQLVRIPVKNIDPAYLYAPFRLYEQIHLDKSNPYFEPLLKAVAEGNVATLVQARVHVLQGAPTSAISSYLATDPGKWTLYDVARLEQLRINSGFTKEVDTLIYAALRGGRIAASVASLLIDLISVPASLVEPEFSSADRDAVINPAHPAGKLALKSAQQLLSQRQQFVNRDYAALLQLNANRTPAILATETITLSFLAAVATGNRLQADRWGQEIKRRHPDQETIEWLAELNNST